ncbi:hypothetical protein [Natrialba aegyptia]|uniref:Uncharacterized protein n=1 Tax=Natrialba aegyptia DSM 13077 TaxID=1227491 RepID=M0BAQ0_9EURY|nr:hypothetical protein [Natrialba aegyptia]ELZ07378.1 hypothetical protein C480_04961 [Natrialba aegyptia DSM 13077]
MTRSSLRPSPPTLALAALGGAANVVAVLALFARADYPALESPPELAVLAATGFALGFVSLFVSAHTRLLTPAVGFVVVLLGTVFAELTTPMPEWSELGGYVVVEGPTHVWSYANSWDVWLSLLLIAGLVEFGVRRGYGLGDRRLRNLPSIPLSRTAVLGMVTVGAGLLGVATTRLVLRAGINPRAAAPFVFVAAAAVAAVPLAALLTRGLLLPTVLFALLVPYFLTIEVFTATDSPVHILLFGPYAVGLLIGAAFENWLRSRLRGWNGGRFADHQSA